MSSLVPVAMPCSVIAAALLLACGAGPPPARAPAPPAPEPAPRVVFAAQQTCHGEADEATVIRDGAAWQAWHDRATCGAGMPPGIDFSRETLIAVSITGTTGCHSVRIDGVARTADGVTVDVVRVQPAPGAICTQVIVHPACAVAVARFEGTARFAWRDAVGGGR